MGRGFEYPAAWSVGMLCLVPFVSLVSAVVLIQFYLNFSVLSNHHIRKCVSVVTN